MRNGVRGRHEATEPGTADPPGHRITCRAGATFLAVAPAFYFLLTLFHRRGAEDAEDAEEESRICFSLRPLRLRGEMYFLSGAPSQSSTSCASSPCFQCTASRILGTSGSCWMLNSSAKPRRSTSSPAWRTVAKRRGATT